MVTEHARLTVDPDRAAAFEEAVARGQGVLQRSPGFLGADLSRCVESPQLYLLQIRWKTLEDHVEVFRHDGLDEWKAIVGPHLVSSEVLHFEPTA